MTSALRTEGGRGSENRPILRTNTTKNANEGGRGGLKSPKICGRHKWEPPNPSYLIFRGWVVFASYICPTDFAEIMGRKMVKIICIS